MNAEDLIPHLFLLRKVKRRKPRRVGSVLAFASVDEKGLPVLLCNSLELSSSYNPLEDKEMERLTTHTMQYVQEYAENAGFLGVAIGNHNYNTAINHIDPSNLIEHLEGEQLVKVPKDHPKFYSEVFDDKKNVALPEKWNYVELD